MSTGVGEGVLVRFRAEGMNVSDTKSERRANNVAFRHGSRVLRNFRRGDTALFAVPTNESVTATIASLKADPSILYAEPNFRRYKTTIATDDPSRAELWGLDNTGQTVQGIAGTAGADISAVNGWSISEGEQPVIVADVDTGVAYNHPELINRMWDGTSCKSQSGAALGGCLHGYDFEDSDPNPLPTVESHGTHVSGIIAAEKNNGKGGMGVAQNARIMALKFGFDVASEVASIDFAIQNGAKVINASYGGPDFSQAEYDAIDRFRAAGGVFVAAAGNSGLNNDAPSQHNYPSDYNLPNIISVAATDAHDALASFSNYGSTSIDVGAPGVNILSSIADSVVSSETFQSLTAPAVPDGWTATGNWGTRAIAG